MARWARSSLQLAAGLGLTAAVVMSLIAAQQPPATGRKVFANSVIPLPDQAGVVATHGLLVHQAIRDHSKEKMEVLFSMSIPEASRAKLEEKALKGQVVTPQELKELSTPKAEDVERLAQWLKDQGLEITDTSADKTSIYTRGTLEQFQKSLQIKMVRVTKDGQTYNAAQNAPSLPSDIGAGVQAIIGLQPFRQFTKHARRHRPVNPTPAIANAPPFLVKEVLKAYNADGLNVTGKGQTIAILIDTFPHDADTKHFWTKNNLPITPNRIEKVNVKGGTLPPVEGEESMDVQWSSGTAPEAKVRVYATGSLAFVDLDKGLDRIIADATADPGLRQLSISLGLGEQFLSPNGALDGEIQIERDKFIQLASLGVNVFVSSGDAGSNPDSTGHGSGPLQQAEWMATCPFVVGVGGTSLQLTGAGGVNSELAWPSSGGGKSKVFPRPPFQAAIPESDQKRLVPDVSLVADPATGVYVRVNNQDDQFGGTSLSAPVWAGFCALINDARTRQNKPTLPFMNPLIYPLMGSDCFRDITQGDNGGFPAGPGYDMVTGLGVPNVKNLITKLTQ